MFYLLRRSFRPDGGTGGVWALLLGSITALIQFFLGDLVSPGGFGYSRYLYGFIDIVSLPVIIPLVLYLLMSIVRGFSNETDFGNFALLWMIPAAGLKALSWSSTNDPILLVMAPLLWTALASGIPVFIRWMMNNFTWYSVLISFPCIVVLPFCAAGAYWAFFSQQTLLGYALLAASHLPLGAALVFNVIRK